MSQTDPPAKKTSSGTSSKTRQSSSRKPSAKKGASKSAGSKAVAKQRQKRLLYRTIRSCIYLFMAFVGTLSLFSVSGFMIDWYKYLVGSLFGYGFYLAPLAFLWAAVMIFIRMKSKVRARETAIFMIPMLFGSMGHLVRASYPIGSGMEGFKQLAETGRALTSGGVFSGGLAMLLKAALSAGGGVLLCMIAIAACLFVATGTNPVAFVKGLRPTPEEEYEEEEPARKPAKRTRIHEDTGERPAPARSSSHETASISHELPPRRMSLEEAAMAPGGLTFLYDGIGKVCGEYIWAYPPGIPLVTPGEEITANLVETVETLYRSGVRLLGTRGKPPFTTFAVADEENQ